MKKNCSHIFDKFLRVILVISILFIFFFVVYLILKLTGVWEEINSVEKLQGLILSLGIWGRIAFVFIQFLQVTFVPIPSTITTLAGVLVYGPLECSILSFAGLLLGSVVAFALGRTCGKTLCDFMVGKETCEKWRNVLSKAKYTFVLMMLFPFFPDDILCLVAGLTTMSWRFFVVTNIITRPIGIVMTCYFGSGQIIPYSGWGLVVWGVIVVSAFICLFLSYKCRDKIEKFMTKFSKSIVR